MIATATCEEPLNQGTKNQSPDNQTFYDEVMQGLRMSPKQLPSKYFYDAIGDKLFQDIMNCEDYYLTRCEMEIFTQQTGQLVNSIMESDEPFDLVELGPGDCTKSIHLFRGLIKAGADFNYLPIDISQNIIRHLEKELPESVPGIKVSGLNGEYFSMLEQLSHQAGNRKVVMCLGGNIGNMTIEESHAFCKGLRRYLTPGDMLIIGFDLVKNPAVIRNAYDDREGITRRFNLNLLRRMNRELHTDFSIDSFEHYCSYDPETGACKSYLVCLEDMQVHFHTETVCFKKDECIWMEISQKHTVEQIDHMAATNGFQRFRYLTDSQNWFVDAIWVAN
ncbi:histidine-specific methyltransferase [Russula earlei]|uniref:Histidine-specific methyltransferase n=1 Tax=Russula earlei TaxID=71964 RepID=A0ACC0TU70_9AGAM|nr:histidine-specific methyltransferase [Russula earlei]